MVVGCLDCFVLFSPNLCILQDRAWNSLIRLGRKQRGVYPYQSITEATIAAVTTTDSYELWHQSLGHPVCQSLSHLLDILVGSPLSKSLCDICCRAKHTLFPFPFSMSCVSNSFALIHSDIWGPHRSSTFLVQHIFCLLWIIVAMPFRFT